MLQAEDPIRSPPLKTSKQGTSIWSDGSLQLGRVNFFKIECHEKLKPQKAKQSAVPECAGSFDFWRQLHVSIVQPPPADKPIPVTSSCQWAVTDKIHIYRGTSDLLVTHSSLPSGAIRLQLSWFLLQLPAFCAPTTLVAPVPPALQAANVSSTAQARKSGKE